MLLFADALREALQGKSRMCVVHMAHAAEILLKARIAQEHPLLIFSKLPKPNNSENTLTLMNLLEGGRTFSYEELPDQLWAATGIKIDCLDEYRKFGRLRNQIIHFSMVNTTSPDTETIKYAFDFLDPLVESFWNRSVLEFVIKDPFHYLHDFKTGILEDDIRNKYGMNDRLRKLLGDFSSQAWERMQDSFKEDRSYTLHLIERYGNLISGESSSHAVNAKNWDVEDEEVDYLQALSHDWEIFLDSF